MAKQNTKNYYNSWLNWYQHVSKQNISSSELKQYRLRKSQMQRKY